MPEESVRGQRQMGQSSDEEEPEAGEGGSSWEWVEDMLLEKIMCCFSVYTNMMQ